MFVHIYTQPWWILLLLMPLMTMIYGVLRWQCKSFFKPLCIISFTLWFALVFCHLLVLRSSRTGEGFRPLFESYRTMAQNNEALRSNFANILLFFPGGMLLYSFLPKQPKYFWLTVTLLCLFSAAAELGQYQFAIGVPEADDILHNTLGAFFGAGAVWIISRCFKFAGIETSPRC